MVSPVLTGLPLSSPGQVTVEEDTHLPPEGAGGQCLFVFLFTFYVHGCLTCMCLSTMRVPQDYLIILPLGEVNLERRQGELLANASLVVDSLRLQRRVLTAVPEGSKAAI